MKMTMTVMMTRAIVVVEAVVVVVTISLIYRYSKKPKSCLTPYYQMPIPSLLLQYIHNINIGTTLHEVFRGKPRESQK
jgi:hypothetical protein